MIKSMTGFSAVNREHALAAIAVTVRSVNHRYLDVQIRVPPLLAEQENDLRAAVKRWVARGRVELAVTIRAIRPPEVAVTMNESLVEALSSAVARVEERGLSTGGLSSSDILRFPQAVVVLERETDTETRGAIRDAVAGAVDDALHGLDVMRVREGTYLRTDLDGRLAEVSALVDKLAAAADAGVTGLIARLTARVAELREHTQADESVVAQELVRVAGRSDVSEELARLRGHVTHWAVLADAPEPCGRKLDFLLQEMNREINTLGAKIEGPDVSESVVAAKAELEKLREQAQNVE